MPSQRGIGQPKQKTPNYRPCDRVKIDKCISIDPPTLMGEDVLGRVVGVSSKKKRAKRHVGMNPQICLHRLPQDVDLIFVRHEFVSPGRIDTSFKKTVYIRFSLLLDCWIHE